MVVAKTCAKPVFWFDSKNKIYDQSLSVFALNDEFFISILSSEFYYSWVYKYGGSMRAYPRFNPSDFETFPFPPGFEPNRDLGVSVPLCAASSHLSHPSHKDTRPQSKTGAANQTLGSSSSPLDASLRDRLETLGAKLDSDRRELMLKLNTGLTKLYNLYHKPELSLAAIVKEAKCPETDANWAIEKIIALRTLHKTIDETVRDAYRWQDIPLQHGFYELEFLPENDRVRYTVSNTARKLILSELLKLNHTRHAEELAAGLVDENGKILRTNPNGDTKTQKKKTPQKDEGQEELF